MHIKKLIEGEKIEIYLTGEKTGDGVRGKEENIVEVVWRKNFKGVGMAEYGDGTPVNIGLNDGDIVMMEPVNTIKNAFWDAGIHVGVVGSRYNGLTGDFQFEVLNYGGCKGDVLMITSIDGEVIDATAQVKLGHMKDYEALVAKINLYYKH